MGFEKKKHDKGWTFILLFVCLISLVFVIVPIAQALSCVFSWEAYKKKLYGEPLLARFTSLLSSLCHCFLTFFLLIGRSSSFLCWSSWEWTHQWLWRQIRRRQRYISPNRRSIRKPNVSETVKTNLDDSLTFGFDLFLQYVIGGSHEENPLFLGVRIHDKTTNEWCVF